LKTVVRHFLLTGTLILNFIKLLIHVHWIYKRNVRLTLQFVCPY